MPVAALLLVSWSLTAYGATRERPVPVKPGVYTFQYRDAEFRQRPGTPVKVRIRGRHITVVNEKAAGPFPAGVIEEATLMWHAKSRKWILGDTREDRDADDVGGCSGGPLTIDFKNKVIWFC